MALKLTILFGHPDNADDFETYYTETHLPLVAKSPLRLETSKVVADPAGGEPAYYRIAVVSFDDMEQVTQQMALPEVQAVSNDVANFATGGVTMLLSQVD